REYMAHDRRLPDRVTKAAALAQRQIDHLGRDRDRDRRLSDRHRGVARDREVTDARRAHRRAVLAALVAKDDARRGEGEAEVLAGDARIAEAEVGRFADTDDDRRLFETRRPTRVRT